LIFKRKPTTDEEARIITNLVGQRDSIWNQLTAANEKLAAADGRYHELKRERDYWREQANEYRKRWEGK